MTGQQNPQPLDDPPAPLPDHALFKFLRYNIPQKKVLLAVLALLLLGAGFTLLANLAMILSTGGRVIGQAEAVPARDVALVLGARGFHLTRRIDTAAELYKTGKVRCLLVSGDNHIRGYDEPSDMKHELILRGVPERVITCDYAGFRTLDSLVRAKKVFGLDRLVIVTQRFHAYRALAIARRAGIDAVACCAGEPPKAYRWRSELREVAARPVALLDLYLFRRQPRFLGRREIVNGL